MEHTITINELTFCRTGYDRLVEALDDHWKLRTASAITKATKVNDAWTHRYVLRSRMRPDVPGIDQVKTAAVPLSHIVTGVIGQRRVVTFKDHNNRNFRLSNLNVSDAHVEKRAARTHREPSAGADPVAALADYTIEMKTFYVAKRRGEPFSPIMYESKQEALVAIARDILEVAER